MAERNPLHETSPLSRPLELLTAWALRAPGAVLSGCVLVALLAILVSITSLTFKTNRLDLLNPNSSYNQRWLAYLAEFGDGDDAVIVVRGANQPTVTACLDDLAASLRRNRRLFQAVLYQRDLSAIKKKGLHFAPLSRLRQIDQQVRLVRENFAASESLDPSAALAKLNDGLAQLLAASAPARAANAQQMRQAQEPLERGYLQAAGMLLPALAPQSPLAHQWSGPGAAPGGLAPLPDSLMALDPHYLLEDDGRMGFALLRFGEYEDEFARGGKAVGALRGLIDEVRLRHPQAWIGLTGMPIIEFDEMQASQTDTIWTSLLSLVGVALLFVAGYGGLRHAMLAVAVLLLGTAWSFGFVTIFVGHLNILSAAFAVVLIGLGIDFGIHYIAAYLKLRYSGVECGPALIKTAADVGPGVMTGAITTAAAFFMAGLTDFIGVRELGIVAGGGILLCVLATVIALPPLVYLFDRNRPAAELPRILPAAAWFQFSLRRPRLVALAGVALTLLLGLGSQSLRYDHNLLNLQPRHVESVEIEKELFARSDDSVWCAISICDSALELRRRKAQFDKLASVSKTEEISSLIPASDRPKQAAIASIQENLAALLAPASTRPVAINIRLLRRELLRAEQLSAAGSPQPSPSALVVRQLNQALRKLSDAQAQTILMAYQAKLRSQIQTPLRGLAEIADAAPPTLADIPRELTQRFIGKSGKHLLKIYPRGNIWDMDKLTHFVADVETVDAQVTGHPVQTYYASRHMQTSYVHAGIYALIAVFGLLMVDFRSIRYSLLAMVPLAFGCVQLAGLIGWFDIPLNPANMIVLPLILGIGVDDGVHLVHELRRQRGRFQLSDSTTVAVLLTSTTTMASFGSMILARHQGLQSLGQVLTIGVVCCLFSSIAIFPAILAWLTWNRPKQAEDEAVADEKIFPATAAESLAANPDEEPAVVPFLANQPSNLNEESDLAGAPPAREKIAPRRRVG